MAEDVYLAEDNYVHKDVFNARMDRLEMLIEKNGTELRELRNEVNMLEGRLVNVVDLIYFQILFFFLALLFAVIVPKIVKFWEKVFAPSVTREDVKQIVNEEVEHVVNDVVRKHLADLAIEQEGK